MKKILLALTILIMSISTLQANKAALAHANPMPNLMRIAVGNAELLNINEEQMKAIKTWIKTEKPKMKKLIMKVMEEEKMLMDKALNTDEDTVKLAETMLETRKQIIAKKTKCRVTLKGILTKEQYANVVKIYKSTGM